MGSPEISILFLQNQSMCHVNFVKNHVSHLNLLSLMFGAILWFILCVKNSEWVSIAAGTKHNFVFYLSTEVHFTKLCPSDGHSRVKAIHVLEKWMYCHSEFPQVQCNFN